MNKYLLSEMSWTEIEKCVEENKIPVLPVGSLEQHGKHLPLNVDYFLCEKVVHNIAKKREDLLVLPTVVYGRSSHHLPYCGTISLSVDTFINMIVDILVSLSKHGFERIVIINGHGGNRASISAAVEKFQERDIKHPLVFIGNYYSFGKEKVIKLRESKKGGMAHAGEFETSLSLYLQPELVEMEKAENRVPVSPIPEYIYADLLGDSSVSLAVSHDEEDKKFWEYTFCQSGVAGNPQLATRNKGKTIFEVVSEDMMRFFEQMKKIDVD